MADIEIYGAIRSMTGDNKSAYASQVYDEDIQKFQSEINQEIIGGGYVSANNAQSFTNAEKAQARTNIDALGSITQDEFNAIFND
jgi:hypothetical protein